MKIKRWFSWFLIMAFALCFMFPSPALTAGEGEGTEPPGVMSVAGAVYEEPGAVLNLGELAGRSSPAGPISVAGSVYGSVYEDLSAWADRGSFESVVNYVYDEALNDVWDAAASSETAQMMAGMFGVEVTDGPSLKAMFANMASVPANDGTPIHQIEFGYDYKTINFCGQAGNVIESHSYSFVEINDHLGMLAGEDVYVFKADDEAGVLNYMAMLEPGFDEGMDETTMPAHFHFYYAAAKDALGTYQPDSVTLSAWMPTMLQMGDEFSTADKTALLECLFGINNPFAGGSGTVEDPYQIVTPEQLNQVRYHLDQHFKLIENISLENYDNWEPIGVFEPLSDAPEHAEVPRPAVAFTGSFDGGEKTISNVNINRPDEMAVGLFGCAVGTEENPGSIYNLTVNNVNAAGYYLVGGVVGLQHTNFAVENVALTGSNKVQGLQGIGGVIGTSFDIVKDCTATADIVFIGDDGICAGVVVGGTDGGSLINCKATGGSVTATGNNCWALGGVSGAPYAAQEITNCHAENVTITASGTGSRLIGGLVGFAGTFGGNTPTSVTGCTVINAAINVSTSATCVGGLVGGSTTGYTETIPSVFAISDCSTSGTITGGSEALGSIAGYAYRSTVKNCTSTMTINGDSNPPQVGWRAVAQTVTEDDKEVVITPDTPEELAIAVPAGVTGATVNVAALLGAPAAGRVSARLPALNIAATTSISANPIEVNIPAGTTVSAPSGWDGTINAPNIRSNNSVAVTPDSGKTAAVNAVIEIGYGDVPLIFDKAVRILIPGQAGKDVGYSRGGVFTKITNLLSADSQAAGDALPPGGDGRIDVGNDLVVWTKHFTPFVTYTQTTESSDDGGSGGGSSSSEAVRSTTGTATLTPGHGGTVSLGNEATVVIPANALRGTDKVEIKIKKVSSPPAAPAGFKLAGTVYQFSVDGADNYSFAGDVTLKISFDPDLVAPGETPRLQYYDQTRDQWVDIGGSVSGNLVIASVDHFTQFAVMAAVKEAEEEKTQPSPEVSGKAFNDITGHWAFGNIRKLVELNAISGYPDGSFRPDSSITRAEFATVLAQAFKLAPQDGGRTFADTADHWARNYIAALVAEGIVGGYDASTFAPDDLITREQMAVMIVKAAGLSLPPEETSFTDRGSISAWAREAMATVVKNGIMAGYPDNTVRPQANATRAEAATVIVQALN